MGTRFELVVEGDQAERHRAAAEAALDAVDACHTRFSRFIPDSLLAHLARIPPGTPVSLDRETFELFADAVAVWRGSGGAFDIAGGSGAMSAVRLDARRLTVALEHPGLLLDLGAIAKGHAVDRAAGMGLPYLGVPPAPNCNCHTAARRSWYHGYRVHQLLFELRISAGFPCRSHR
jgi:thiamine biosynthesis lipoprotein